MEAADVEAVVALHEVCFREYFLTALGKPILTRFYRMAITDDLTVALVLEEQGSCNLIGFAAGTLNGTFSTQLVRRHLGPFAWAVFSGAISQETVRRGLWRRRGILRAFMPELFQRIRLAAAGGRPNNVGTEARFLDVGIHPARRGGMNAEFLVCDLMRRIFQLGAARFVGTVDPRNLPSLILHKRLGFDAVKISSERIKVSIGRDEFVRRMASCGPSGQ